MKINGVITKTGLVTLGATPITLVFPNVNVFGIEVDGKIAVDLIELKKTFEAEGWNYDAFIKDFKVTATIADAKDPATTDRLQQGLTEFYRLQQEGEAQVVPENLKHAVNGVNVALAGLAQRSFAVTPIASNGKKVSWEDTYEAINAALAPADDTAPSDASDDTTDDTATPEIDAATTTELPTEQEKVVPDATTEPDEDEEEETATATEELPVAITNQTDLIAASGVLGKIVAMNAAAIQSNRVIGELMQSQMTSFAKLAELQTLNTTQLEAANELFTGLQAGLGKIGVTAIPETV